MRPRPGQSPGPQTIQGDPSDGHAKLAWFARGSTNFYRETCAGCQQLQELTR